MKGKKGNTQLEAGLMSMTGYLAVIANDTKAINQKLSEISIPKNTGNFEPNNLNITNLSKTVRLNLNQQYQIKNILQNIYDSLQVFFGTPNETNSFLKNLDFEILSKNSKLQTTIQTSILTTLVSTLAYLKRFVGSTQMVEASLGDNLILNELNKNMHVISQITASIRGIVSAILNVLQNQSGTSEKKKSKITTNLNSKEIKGYAKLIKALEGFPSKKKLADFHKLVGYITDIDVRLNRITLNIQKLQKLKDNIISEKIGSGWKLNKIAIGLILLSLALGLFFKTLLLVKLGFVASIKLSIILKSLEKPMKGIGIALIGLGIALYFVAKAPWYGTFMILGFLTALIPIIFILQKVGKVNSTKGIFGIPMAPSTGLGGIAFGLIGLSIALRLMDGIKWTNPIMLLTMILGLAFALKLFNSITKGSRFGIGNSFGLIGFSLALSILILAVDAADELTFFGVIKLCAFVIALGFAIKISGLGGRITKMSGMFGFAMGIAILILAVDAANELNWKGAMNLIAFIIGIGLAMNLANGGHRTGGAFNTKGMFGFAMGIGILVLVVAATSELNWISALYLIGFIYGLGLAMRSWTGITWKQMLFITGTIILFAASIGVAALLMIPAIANQKGLVLMGITTIAWCGILMIIQKMKINPTTLIPISGSICLSILLFATTLGAASILLIPIVVGYKLLGVMTAFIFVWFGVIALLNRLKINSRELITKTGAISLSVLMFSATLGLASILLIPIAMNGMKNLTFMIAYLGAWLGLLILLEKAKQPIKNSLLAISIISLSIFMLSTSLYMASISRFNINNIIILIGVTVLFVGLLMVIEKVKTKIATAIFPVLIMAVSALILSFAIKTIMTINPDYNRLLVFGVSVVGLVGLFLLATFASAPILIGSGIFAVVGISLILLALSLKLIEGININKEKMQTFTDAIIYLVQGIGRMDPLMIIAAVINSAFLIVIGATMILVAGLFLVISLLPIRSTNLEIFKESILNLTTFLGNISLVTMLKATANSVMLIVVSVSLLAAAIVLQVVSQLEMKPKNLDDFRLGVKGLIDTISEYGIISLGKTAIKAGLLLPVAITGYVLANLMKKITEVELKPSQIDSFGSFIDSFVDCMINAVEKAKDKLNGSKDALAALAQISSIGKNLVDIIIATANGTYTEYEVKNGVITPKAVKQIDYSKLDQMIGPAFGNLLAALIKPLAEISSDKDTWQFNGVSVMNPFKKKGFFGGDNNSGANRVKMIGEAFLPLIDIINSFGTIELFKDQQNVDRFNSSIISVIQSSLNAFDILNQNDLVKSSESIKTLYDIFEKLRPITNTGYGMAVTMQKISETKFKVSDIEAFGLFVNTFVDNMIIAVEHAKEKLLNSEDAFKSLIQLTNVGKSLVDLIVAFANGTYTEYGVKDGQIIPLSVHKINYSEVATMVSEPMGKLISALVLPLAVMSSDADVWDFGNGTKVQNPFKGKKGKLGIDNIQQIANSYTPLIDLVSKFGTIEFLTEQTRINTFNSGIISVVEASVSAMNLLAENDFSKANNSITQLSRVFDGFAKFDYQNVDKMNIGIDKFMQNMSDEKRWDLINKNIKSTGDSIDKIVTSVNKLNLEKSGALERNLKLMAEKNSSEQIRKSLEEFINLIGIMNNQAQEQNEMMTTAINGLISAVNTMPKGGVAGNGDPAKVNPVLPYVNTGGETNERGVNESAVLKVLVVNGPSQPIPVDDIEAGTSGGLSTKYSGWKVKI